MRTARWHVLLLVAGLVAVGLLAGCGGRGKPAIDLPTAAYDFGQIQQGEVATIRLPVHNVGTKDLHIKSVTTSCGCTSAKVEPMTISPGDDGQLTINYDSGVHPDKGPIWRIVYITSDDPAMPEATVEVRAEVTLP